MTALQELASAIADAGDLIRQMAELTPDPDSLESIKTAGVRLDELVLEHDQAVERIRQAGLRLKNGS